MFGECGLVALCYSFCLSSFQGTSGIISFDGIEESSVSESAKLVYDVAVVVVCLCVLSVCGSEYGVED